MNRATSSLKPCFLVVPLDWGLGHATRCIPLVHNLLRHDCTVLLAAEGKTRHLLVQEFPHLTCLSIPGYRVTYSKNKLGLHLTIAIQVPRILKAIKNEQIWLQTVVNNHKIDAIISDNRYGLYHPSIPSVFITHQLLVKTPFGKTMDHLLQRLNYRFINRFTECWIPDTEGLNNLAGELSHPKTWPHIPVRYLGPLSRFSETKYATGEHLLILLSGPEPQRTIFEKQMVQELVHYPKPVILVRGLPGSGEQLSLPGNIEVHNHLPASLLEEKIRKASYVISRCGYSTIMDLAVVKKKSILVPTPGQTEQEYLAKHLSTINFALCINQNRFRLDAALDLAASFPYRFAEINMELMEKTIYDFIERLVHHRQEERNKNISPGEGF